jgi:hypothetical protein
VGRFFSTTLLDNVPTLAPNPGSPTATQEHLPGRDLESAQSKLLVELAKLF